MTAANAIELRDVIVRHATVTGPLTALDCPALTLPAKSSTAIVGPSGCGKSTLLGMLAGLALPTKGAVFIGTTDLTTLTESRRVALRKARIGMVYQADNLLPALTVAQNIRLQLALCADTDQAGPRTDQLLDQLGLTTLADRLPDQLSGGQRSRVGDYDLCRQRHGHLRCRGQRHHRHLFHPRSCHADCRQCRYPRRSGRSGG